MHSLVSVPMHHSEYNGRGSVHPHHLLSNLQISYYVHSAYMDACENEKYMEETVEESIQAG